MDRLTAWAGWTSVSWALYALIGLVVAGVILRILASAAAWPTLPTLGDSWPYAFYAGTDVFADPQHPAGYSLFLALVGIFTRSVAAYVVLQHLFGIASAVILFAAVRRLCGSPWPGVVGAAVILLGADQIYLEDLIMSETLVTLLIVSAVYATARALEKPLQWWPWPVIAGALAVAATMTRTAAIFLLPLLALAFLLSRPRPWLPRWRPPVAFAGTVCALLLCYATANAIDHGHFGTSPTPGWHLYARAAPIADCNKFTPPTGTEGLCESKAPADRFGPDWYLYDPGSPGLKLFGPFGANDSKVGGFARQAVLHQPGAYLDAVFTDVAAYFFPGSWTWKYGKGTDIDGQLSWRWAEAEPEETQNATQAGMETFFAPFSASRNIGLIGFFYDYQRIFRFGATALVIATLLILAGLLLGSRRNRIAILLLGVGGLAIFVLPTFSVLYVGRYMVPSSGLLAAGAAVGALSTWSYVQGRMRERRGTAAS